MTEHSFRVITILLAVLFTAIFCFVVVPPLVENPDIAGAFASGFVNPYASGYSIDVIFCWVILGVWVWYEAANYSIHHGWVCLVLGIVPGVAVGFALYLLLRQRQLKGRSDIHT
jgi:hypothetical protein